MFCKNPNSRSGKEYGSTTGRLRNVNWLNLDKLIQAINISGTTHLIISKIDVLLEVQQFRLIYERGLVGYESLELMQNEITNILSQKCPLIEKIIYSDNPYTIESL